MINENIKKMADLLRSGSTMLNMACPVCNNPIFRNKDGNTYCPTCNRKVLVVNDHYQKNKIIEESKKSSNTEDNLINQKELLDLLNSLQSVILEKVNMVTNKLEEETQIQLIETYTRILVNCFEILNKIEIKRETV